MKPTFTVYIYPEAGKQLAALPAKDQKAIDKKIQALADNPFPPGFKKLEASAGYFRIRHGDYRIIYRVEGDMLIVLVVRIGNRRELYKKPLPSPETARKTLPKKKA